MLKLVRPSRNPVYQGVRQTRTYRKKKEPEPVPLPPSGVYEHPTGKKLFTPGPLTTSSSVRQAMMREMGPRETEFKVLVKEIREKVLKVGDFGEEYDCVLMEGCGTMSIESVMMNTIPSGGKLLLVSNGTYGDRLREIAELHSIPVVNLAFGVTEGVNVEMVKTKLEEEEGITHLAMVHCETSTGMLLPWKEVVEVVEQMEEKKRPVMIADAMSSYGCTDMSWAKSVDFLITSPNKCLQGVPGFGVIIFKKTSAERCRAFPKKSWALGRFSCCWFEPWWRRWWWW
eukprot:TRINITY_DN1166_c0_g1_i1.p1 TRINITY_DN1166_c0_g1~~TRINITY_DN1166_c0_g1_i1.p1  ORF type:complete len:285 (-),score=62.85 TRINITY_DN1166_c0_g1_i1:918-1772(-)